MQTVRFAAHMVLLARRVGGSQAPSREACDAVVRCYVSQLVSEGRAELVATYAATLPTADQVSSYVRLLKDMPEDDPEQRELCLTLAREAGLNVPLITRTLVEQVRLADDDFAAPEEASARLRSPDVTPEDLRKVASLDWLLFDPSTRGEALKQANALMRGFVCLGKVAAAREAFRRLPSDSVDVVSAQWSRTTEGRSAAADDENAVREFFCFQALLQAHQSFQDWFEQFHRHKPAPPEEVAPGARFSEKVAHEHRVRSHQLELQQWRGTVSTLAREVEKDGLQRAALRGRWLDGGPAGAGRRRAPTADGGAPASVYTTADVPPPRGSARVGAGGGLSEIVGRCGVGKAGTVPRVRARRAADVAAEEQGGVAATA
uniref:Nuclear pore complex protein n=1 Tax=Ixodes ricinus TaxID=34613 RepID=V5HGL5_IXORI